MRPAQYIALYIAGGLVLIGSHVIGLVLMAVAGLIGLAALLDRPDFWPRFKQVLAANIALALLAAPWILQILLSTGTHPGLLKLHAGDIVWMVFNMAGFPGLGQLSKPFEIILFLLAGSAILLCWLNNRRTLGLMLLPLIVILPLTLAAPHLLRPVLENRVVLPIALGIAMGFGVAVSHIPVRAVRLGLVAAILAAGLGSTLAEMTDRQKPDDYRGAYAFIDGNGYTGAPVLVCRNYGGAALAFERENDIFYYKPDGVLEQSRPGYWRVAAIPAVQLEVMPAAEIDSRIGGGFLLEEGLTTLFARSDRIAFVRPFCPAR